MSRLAGSAHRWGELYAGGVQRKTTESRTNCSSIGNNRRNVGERPSAWDVATGRNRQAFMDNPGANSGRPTPPMSSVFRPHGGRQGQRVGAHRASEKSAVEGLVAGSGGAGEGAATANGLAWKVPRHRGLWCASMRRSYAVGTAPANPRQRKIGTSGNSLGEEESAARGKC